MITVMNKATLLTAVGLLLVSMFLVSATSVQAADWEQVGYGTLQSGSRFDVYVDTRTILHIGDKVRFWQGHVFYTEQQLPSGAPYMRVSIEREGDCVEKSDKSLQAIFYARDGSVLKNYNEGNALKPAGPDTIRRQVLEFVCTYKN
jgi:surface-adhesin protein E